MALRLERSAFRSGVRLDITGSKSESNRLLILQALLSGVSLDNLSNADDVRLMQRALSSTEDVVDIHHAGTAMRFLTAYFAASEGREVVLTGSARMKQRPVKVLVDALGQMGAEINYLENPGYPPIRIHGRTLKSNSVELKADVSSQYITALMLIGSRIPGGLKIGLQGKPTSVPYILMTKGLLNQLGIDCDFSDNTIRIGEYVSVPVRSEIKVESDWSSASYFYSLVAIADVGSRVFLSSYRKNSLQGDSALQDIYRTFGVESSFEEDVLCIEKRSTGDKEKLLLDLADTPDIAQTLAVTCLALDRPCEFSGLHTLKIKETDRLVALKQEIEKFGGTVEITDNSLELYPVPELNSGQLVETYNDHRMAMAFAPLALLTNLVINDHEVVSKSYPDFWSDLSKLGVQIGEN